MDNMFVSNIFDVPIEEPTVGLEKLKSTSKIKFRLVLDDDEGTVEFGAFRSKLCLSFV